MKLPRDLSGVELAKLLRRFGYQVIRQSGSHMRLKTLEHGEHYVTVPRHESLRIGTLNDILNDVAAHFGLSRDQVLERLFGK